MSEQAYNAKEDGEGSYLAAIEAKRLRGDRHYLLPHKDSRNLRDPLPSLTNREGTA